MIRREFAQQNLDQRRLSGAVRAHDGEPVAPLDPDGQVLDDHLFAETLGNALGLSDPLAG